MKAFVVSDVHGQYNHFKEILKHWDQNHKLILLGDMIDRGKYSFEVINEIIKLKEQYGDNVVYLTGNHEDMLFQFLNNPYECGQWYFQNGGGATIQSFYKKDDLYFLSFEERAEIMAGYEKQLKTMHESLLYYEFGDVLLTHAGFQSLHRCWQETSDVEYYWIRDHYKHENCSGMINVFGHTPTRIIHDSDDIWISKCQTYIGIDGGCAYGGQLNAILINENGNIIDTYSVK